MNCKFCQAILIQNTTLTYRCPQCYSRFSFNNAEAQKMISYMLVAKYGDHYYGAVFYITSKHFMLERLDLDKKTGKAVYYSKEPLLQLAYLPNITPENFAKKLPTLLTFS